MKRLIPYLLVPFLALSCVEKPETDNIDDKEPTTENKPPQGEDDKVYTGEDIMNRKDLILDFSYAGYMHGESAPLEASAWGYKVYDVTSYGAVPNDGKSDREAFLACVEAATGQKFAQSDKSLTLGHKEKANAIIYFPEG